MYDLKSIIAFREAKGKQKLILDTNLLILLLVGFFDPDHIENCPRTKGFCKDDFDLLLKILENFESEIIITPHVLAELSNLSKSKMGVPEDKISSYFKVIIDKLSKFQEEHIPLKELIGIDLKILVRFGFPDMSIIESSKKLRAIILTKEDDMVDHARSIGIKAINFTNIRTALH